MMLSSFNITLFLLCIIDIPLIVATQKNNFELQPESVVQAKGLEAEFTCYCPGAHIHAWGINGEFLNDDQFPSDMLRIPPSGDSPARLIIPATPQYNNTVVQCKALFDSESYESVVLSNNASLLVQGLFNGVVVNFEANQLSSSSITISWDPPFSLNLTTAEPDIQYCVNVYPDNGENLLLVESVCDITSTLYMFSLNANDLSERHYLFTVTPKSNVEGSINGTTSSLIQGHTCEAQPSITEVIFTANVNLNPVTVRFNHEQNDNLCEVTHSYLHLKLISEGLLNKQPLDNDIISCVLSSSRDNNPNIRLLTFNNITCDIQRHKLYKIRIHEKYNGGNITSDWIEISTHDVQYPNLQNYPCPWKLTITNTYLKKTRDVGVLHILQSLNESSENVYHSGLKDSLQTIVTIGNLSSSTYQIFSFDIEPNGYPRPLPAALPQFIEILAKKNMTFSKSPSPFVNATITTYEGTVCMSCSFSTRELTGCVGVIHSAQLEDPTLTILTVERSGGVNIDCTNLKLINGKYYIAVFGQQEDRLDQSPSLVKTILIDLQTTVTTNKETVITPSGSPGTWIVAVVMVVCQW